MTADSMKTDEVEEEVTEEIAVVASVVDSAAATEVNLVTEAQMKTEEVDLVVTEVISLTEEVEEVTEILEVEEMTIKVDTEDIIEVKFLIYQITIIILKTETTII